MPRNLRILKKLSKRAAPLLPILGDKRDQFPADKFIDDSCIGCLIRDRKSFERGRSNHAKSFSSMETKKPAADGRGFVYMRPPSTPLDGTIMVGSMRGYYEPEWEEESAWEALQKLVLAHYADWLDNGAARLSRRLDTPRDIFRAAEEITRNSVNS